jgi:hypothetical protein
MGRFCFLESQPLGFRRFVKPGHCREDAEHRNDCEAGVDSVMRHELQNQVHSFVST